MSFDSEFDDTVRIKDARDLRFGNDDDIGFYHYNDPGDEYVEVKDSIATTLMKIAQNAINFVGNIKFMFGTRLAQHIYMRYDVTSNRLEFRNEADTLIFSLGNSDLTAILNAGVVSTTMETSAVVFLAQSNVSSASTHVGYLVRGARGGATPSIVSSGDLIYELMVNGYDGADFQTLARMTIEVGGTPGVGDMPGVIKFWTTPEGSSTALQRFSIGPDGTATFEQDVVIEGNLTSNAGRVKHLTVVVFGDSPYSVLPDDHILLVNTTGGAVEIVLEAAPGTGRELIIKDTSGTADTNAITVTPDAGDTIDGAASADVDFEYGELSIVFDGTNWKKTVKINPSGFLADGDYGDVSVSGGGATFTIDAGAVTAAKTSITGAPDGTMFLRDDWSWQSIVEAAQDAVGAMIDASLAYVDGTPLLQRAALTGDVTAAAGNNATTIANDAVTYAKMQNVSATDKLLGRVSTGAGNVEEVDFTNLAQDLVACADLAAMHVVLDIENVDNTSDADKEVSTAQNTAISKQRDYFVQAHSFNPLDNGSNYFGALPQVPEVVSGRDKVYFRNSGVIDTVNLYTYAQTVVGSSEAWDMRLKIGSGVSVGEYSLGTVSAATAERVFTADLGASNIIVANGDWFQIHALNPNWATPPEGVVIAGTVVVHHST